ncbi:hypothetical protein RND81_07G169900 [Saponaria officinalis]|uniref:NAB domain-containing protein n=1 Tax=Saponaria officinalis TaxID=3572 RepID=A0AAW1JSS2_SAPOF
MCYGVVFFTRIPYTLFTADLDQRIKILVLNYDNGKDEEQSDTFAKRAESYYQQRPKLLSLLLDLYNNYLSLADRYCLFLHNSNHRHVLTSSSELFSSSEDYQSDAESSLSYQVPSAQIIPVSHQNNVNDEIVTELVIKNVEYDLMVHELGLKERQPLESSRKIELQRSLLEVLESERMILLNENAELRFKVKALVEENKGLASESMFMKRKAGELARCVLNMRKDYRVCVLSRKIEDLQGKIYGLERRNREYHLRLAKHEKGRCPSSEEVGATMNDGGGIRAETCFQGRCDDKKGVKFSKWWSKIKCSDLLFLCKPHPSE